MSDPSSHALESPAPILTIEPQPEAKPALDGRRMVLNAYRNLMKDCADGLSRAERREVRRAFEYSMKAHEGAVRKSGEPYILHPIAVARILVKEMGVADKTAIICALLHDVVEDTFAEVEDIAAEFGPRVGEIVEGLTKISVIIQPTQTRQSETFRRMLLTMANDIRVALIKIADRLHNMRTLDHMNRTSQVKIAAETEFIYAPLAHRLGLYNIKTELDDLVLRYSHPEPYFEIQQKLSDSRAARDRFIQTFIRPIRERLNALGIRCTINGRVKSISSIYQKMQRQDVPFSQVYDIFAIRIIIDTDNLDHNTDGRDLCWKAYNVVTSFYKPHPERLRDWITFPKSSGYQSLHTTVMGPRGRWVEVQIRTDEMHRVAEQGLAAHWKYKEGGVKADERMERWLQKIRSLLEQNSFTAQDLVNEVNTNLVSVDIYVFTPKGDVITLPVGATALDFAYEIHTNIGDHCIGAKVNNHLVPLNFELRNGDQVEIITSKVQRPEPEWLNFARTTKAQHKIKSALKEQRREIIDKGRKLFDWRAKQLKVTEEHEAVKELLRWLRIGNLEEFYYRLGSHRIDVPKITEFIKRRLRQMDSRHFFPTDQNDELPTDPVAPLAQPNVSGEFNSRLAICCNPLPGDEVVGFVEKDAHVVIHKANCPQAKELMSSQRERIISVKWNENDNLEVLTTFELIGNDSLGMLNKIVRVISLVLKKNIRSLTLDSQGGIFRGRISLYVHHRNDVDKIILELEKINGIHHVKRVEML